MLIGVDGGRDVEEVEDIPAQEDRGAGEKGGRGVEESKAVGSEEEDGVEGKAH